jgi:thiamine biosynthesis protein ThiS
VEEDDEGQGQGEGLPALSTITDIVNDERHELPDVCTVTALLASMDLGPKWVVVERNGEPVEKRDMDTTVLADGDRLELVKAVAGG